MPECGSKVKPEIERSGIGFVRRQGRGASAFVAFFGCLIERCLPRHGNRNVGRLFENKLADLDADFPDPKFPQKMRREIVGQCFQKFGGLPREKIFRVLTERRIVDRPRDPILQITEVACRPQSNIKDKALALGSFGLRNADPRKHFELLNVNLLLSANSHFFEALPSGQSTF